MFVVEQFCMITGQISSKQEYLALCLQPWFVFLTSSMLLLELLHVLNERTKQSDHSGGGANTYLRVVESALCDITAWLISPELRVLEDRRR